MMAAATGATKRGAQNSSSRSSSRGRKGNQHQKWMDKHEEEEQQPGLWHAEAESDGAYCDESAIDIDRLIASME